MKLDLNSLEKIRGKMRAHACVSLNARKRQPHHGARRRPHRALYCAVVFVPPQADSIQTALDAHAGDDGTLCVRMGALLDGDDRGADDRGAGRGQAGAG